MKIIAQTKNGETTITLSRDKKEIDAHPKPFSENEIQELYQAHVFLRKMFSESDNQEGGDE